MKERKKPHDDSLRKYKCLPQIEVFETVLLTVEISCEPFKILTKILHCPPGNIGTVTNCRNISQMNSKKKIAMRSFVRSLNIPVVGTVWYVCQLYTNEIKLHTFLFASFWVDEEGRGG